MTVCGRLPGAAACLVFLVAAYGLAGVVLWSLHASFPYDKCSWAEAPFLNDMLALEAGLPPHRSAERGDSYVYAPGGLLLARALLSPFGLQLDLPSIRMVALLWAAAASVVAVMAGKRLAAALLERGPAPPGERNNTGEEAGEDRAGRIAPLPAWIGAMAVMLFLQRSFNGDSPHPDNLHILHTVATMWAAMAAAGSGRAGAWLYAGMLAGGGLWVKQSAIVTAAAVPVAAWLASRDRLRSAAMAAGGVAAVVVPSLWHLMGDPDSRLWLFDLLAAHRIGWKSLPLVMDESLPAHRALLAVLAWPTVPAALRSGGPQAGMARVWLAVGLPVLGMNLVARLKLGGASNSLVIADPLLMIGAYPTLCAAWAAARTSQATAAGRPDSGSGPATGGTATVGDCGTGIGRATAWSGTVRALTLLVVAVAMVPPRKLPPLAVHHAWCAQLVRMLQEDVAAGRRVWVGHSTACRIAAGMREPMPDRIDSLNELDVAGRLDDAGTLGRIRSRHYDRVYLDGVAFVPPRIRSELEIHYRQVAVLPPSGWQLGEIPGWQGLMGPLEVWEPKSAR